MVWSGKSEYSLNIYRPDSGLTNIYSIYDVPCSMVSCVAYTLLSSFFFAGWVISPALRPYMIGPMCNPDIQNLLEAFASLKRVAYTQ